MSSSLFTSRLHFSSLFTFLCFFTPTLSYRPMFIGTFSNPAFIGSIKAADTELGVICSQTTDPSFCLDAFKHDPQTPKANLNQLCAIGLKLATFVSSNAQSQAQSYAQNESDLQLKDKYLFCSNNYNTILDKLNEAGNSLLSRKFGDVKSAANDAYNYATNCSKLFTADTVVGEESRQSETLSQAVVAIAEKLL